MTVAAVMTYTSLVNDIQTYLERTDDQTLEKIPQFIMLAEQIIAAEIKFLGNLTVVTSSMVASDNVIAKPARWRKTVSMNVTVASKRQPVLLRKYEEPNADAMVESALTQIDILDKLDFQNFKISLKASEIFMTLQAYRKLAGQIDQPLHLGITEAGGLRSGTVKSAIGLGALLMEGIGDTIRISLAADPVEEIKVGFDILKSLGIRSKGVNLVACPSCSRQNFDVISVVNQLEARLEDIITPVDVAVIGCIVNGPGEAKVAEIGLTGASPSNLVYVEGKPHHKIDNERLVDELEVMVRARVAQKLASEAAREAARQNIIAVG